MMVPRSLSRTIDSRLCTHRLTLRHQCRCPWSKKCELAGGMEEITSWWLGPLSRSGSASSPDARPNHQSTAHTPAQTSTPQPGFRRRRTSAPQPLWPPEAGRVDATCRARLPSRMVSAVPDGHCSPGAEPKVRSCDSIGYRGFRGSSGSCPVCRAEQMRTNAEAQPPKKQRVALLQDGGGGGHHITAVSYCSRVTYYIRVSDIPL